MAQNVLTISPDNFRKEIMKRNHFGAPCVPTKDILRLIEAIVHMQSEMRYKLNEEAALDLVRKESLCHMELIRRKYITKANRLEYRKWRDSLHKRKYLPVGGKIEVVRR